MDRGEITVSRDGDDAKCHTGGTPAGPDRPDAAKREPARTRHEVGLPTRPRLPAPFVPPIDRHEAAPLPKRFRICRRASDGLGPRVDHPGRAGRVPRPRRHQPPPRYAEYWRRHTSAAPHNRRRVGRRDVVVGHQRAVGLVQGAEELGKIRGAAGGGVPATHAQHVTSPASRALYHSPAVAAGGAGGETRANDPERTIPSVAAIGGGRHGRMVSCLRQTPKQPRPAAARRPGRRGPRRRPPNRSSPRYGCRGRSP